MQRLTFYSWLTLCGGVCFVAGLLLGHFVFPKFLDFLPQDLRSSDGKKYVYVSPLLECGESETLAPETLKSAREDIASYIELEKNNGTLTSAGVYYRNLNNDTWFGVNDKTNFSPGSLLKVPLLMSVLLEAESHPDLLTKKIIYTSGISDVKQKITAQNPVQPGNDYTVQQLIEHMSEESDNNAALLLYQDLGYEKTAQVYTDLDLPPPQADQDYSIDVRGYARFFRILYNATYLSPALSEEALSYLAHASFNDGLVAGVPRGTVVAHKFGEREYAGQSSVAQLHDCGIVYAKTPYLLCIMTQGASVASLAPVIATISSKVYADVTK